MARNEHAVPQNDFNMEDETSEWRSAPASVTKFNDNNPCGGFDCNICLDSVQDPVVTLCGHLYCWPCIYKWLQYQNNSNEDGGQQQQQCPVCKAEVSETTLVPLYGRDQTNSKASKGKAPHLGIMIPRRPLALACGVDALVSPMGISSPRRSPELHHNIYSQQSQQHHPYPTTYAVSPIHSVGGAAPNLFEPVIGMFGEMVYARLFGNTITNLYTYPNSYHHVGFNSPRVRRHVMEADKSLSRICFFLFWCICLCLLLF